MDTNMTITLALVTGAITGAVGMWAVMHHYHRLQNKIKELEQRAEQNAAAIAALGSLKPIKHHSHNTQNGIWNAVAAILRAQEEAKVVMDQNRTAIQILLAVRDNPNYDADQPINIQDILKSGVQK